MNVSTSASAIETRYAGCHFRSRLEARWAVFFDALGIEWQYEPEGFEFFSFQTGPGLRYLPDFYLPATRTWVEVKGSVDAFDWHKLTVAVDYANLPHSFEGLCDRSSTRGLLLLGPVPRPLRGYAPTFPLLQHYKGCWLVPAVWAESGPASLPSGLREYDEHFDSHGYCDEREKWVQVVERVWPEREGWVTRVGSTKVNQALTRARSKRFTGE